MSFIKIYNGIEVTYQSEEDSFKNRVVYLLEFPNGKVYVGQTTREIRLRLMSHCDAKSKCRRVRNAIQKYKQFNVYVLSSNLTIEQQNVFETFFIKAYNSNGTDGYNLNTGGLNRVVSDETKKKISDANKGKKRIGYLPVTEETKKKMSAAKKGKLHPHTDEWNQKISESNKGQKRTITKEKQCEANIKRSKTCAEKRERTPKPIEYTTKYLDTTTGEIYDTMSELGLVYGVSRQRIEQMLKKGTFPFEKIKIQK